MTAPFGTVSGGGSRRKKEGTSKPDESERVGRRPYGPASQEVGDAWIRSQPSLILRVPTVAVPREHNYLINPRHPDASDVEIGEPEPLDLDRRILNG